MAKVAPVKVDKTKKTTTSKKSGNAKKSAPSKNQLITSVSDMQNMTIAEVQKAINGGRIDLDKAVDYSAEPYTNAKGVTTMPFYIDGKIFLQEKAAHAIAKNVHTDVLKLVLQFAAYERDNPLAQ